MVDELVVRAAWLYYVDDLNQEAVARALSVSRPTVSRLLRRAREEGVVEIRVVANLPEAIRLERALVTAYPELTAATVTPLTGADHPRMAVARAGARIFEEAIRLTGAAITVGWGRTLGEMTAHVRGQSTHDATVIDAVGHASTVPGISSLEVTRRLSDRVGARAVHLPAPAVVRPASSAAGMVASEAVTAALRQAREAHVAVVSLGAAGQWSPLRDTELLSDEEWRRLADCEAVGDVLGRFLDRDGQEVTLDSAGWIGLSLEDLREKQRVIGLVAGSEKAAITTAAIRAGILTHLVTDTETAEAIVAAGDD